MWIILAILKWIGILIGAILGLCLLLSALLIFVPIRYRIQGSKKEEVVYSFKFSWLLSFISIKRKEKSDVIRLFVCGIPIRRLTGTKKKRKSPKSPDSNEPQKEPEAQMAEEKPEKENEVKTPEEKTRRKKRKFFSRKGEKGKKKKNFSFQKVSSIIGCVKQDKKAVKRLIHEIRDLICYLSPTKIRGEMVLGTGDPASTGLLFGGISLFPVVYQDGVCITPDFEEKRFEAKGYIKGRIRVIYLLRLMLRLYKDKELKHLWKQINKVKKEAA